MFLHFVTTLEFIHNHDPWFITDVQEVLNPSLEWGVQKNTMAT